MSDDQVMGLIWGVGALALVLSSLTARQLPGGQILRYALLWVGIFAAGYAIFLFRDDFSALWQRAAADIGGTPVATATGTGVTVRRDGDGHFWVEGSTDAGSVRFLIDSGATTTVLGQRAAEELGATVDGGFPALVGTANGDVMMHRATLAQLRIGDIVVTDLQVLVSDADDINVLGMNWLNRMASWRVSGSVMEIEVQDGAGSASAAR